MNGMNKYMSIKTVYFIYITYIVYKICNGIQMKNWSINLYYLLEMYLEIYRTFESSF